MRNLVDFNARSGKFENFHALSWTTFVESM